MKITQVPYIYGDEENLKGFVKDVSQFGYKLSEYEQLRDFRKGMIKLNGNAGSGIQKDESSLKVLVTTGEKEGYYEESLREGGISSVKFHLPEDYIKAVDLMRHNMMIFNKQYINYEIY